MWDTMEVSLHRDVGAYGNIHLAYVCTIYGWSMPEDALTYIQHTIFYVLGAEPA